MDVIGIARRLTSKYTDITHTSCREDIGIGHVQILDNSIMMERTEESCRQAYGVINVHILHLVEVTVIGSAEVTLLPVSLHGMQL